MVRDVAAGDGDHRDAGRNGEAADVGYLVARRAYRRGRVGHCGCGRCSAPDFRVFYFILLKNKYAAIK